MDRLKSTKLGLLNLSGLHRTEAFGADLEYYLGKGWIKNYTPRYFTRSIFVIRNLKKNMVSINLKS